MDEWGARVSRAAQEIEDYLNAHPQAADSVEGIATWWLSSQRICTELEVVRAAVEQLTSSGVVLRVSIDDRHGPVYRLTNKRH